MVVVKIPWNGAEAEVELKKLKFGGINSLAVEASDRIEYNGQLVSIPNPKVVRELTLLKSIVRAPFEVSLANIQDLDNDVGSMLFNECEKLNILDAKKNATSGGQ